MIYKLRGNLIKTISVSFILLINNNLWAEEHNNEYLRLLYLRATQNESSVDSLIHGTFKHTSLSPLEQGYIGSGYFIKCKYLSNPWLKYKYFIVGKQRLEFAISQSKDPIELRYLRYTIQTNLPSLLSYNGDKKEDYMILQRYLSNRHNLETDEDLYMKIKQYLTEYPL